MSKSSELKKKVQVYIINAIDPENYNEDPKTPEDKIKFLNKVFNDEYGWRIKQVGRQKALIDWLQGIPSAINIDFENYKILQLAKAWGSLPTNATEKQEDKILDNWFNFISANILQLIDKVITRKQKIKISGITKQRGYSKTTRDRSVKAKLPGKRKSKSGNVYYEYRKNRSDAKGKLTGLHTDQNSHNVEIKVLGSLIGNDMYSVRDYLENELKKALNQWSILKYKKKKKILTPEFNVLYKRYPKYIASLKKQLTAQNRLIQSNLK